MKKLDLLEKELNQIIQIIPANNDRVLAASLAELKKLVTDLKKPKYLVVYEDDYHCKTSYTTQQGELGTTIMTIMQEVGADTSEFDKDHYNSEDPTQAGGFSRVFYDMELYTQLNMNDAEYLGRIMIFTIEEV